MFDEKQTLTLADKLDKGDVKTRDGAGGRVLSYLEGWHVIEKANEVFGFGSWDIEILEMKQMHEPAFYDPSDPDGPNYEEDPKKRRPAFAVASYSARARVTVYNAVGSRKVVREGWGGHRGFGTTTGEAIENTIKAAETDAIKRAFRTFGNAFGLALYDKAQRNVGTPEHTPALEATRRPAIDVGFDSVPAESGRESGGHQLHRTPESAPRHSNSQRALAHTPDQNGHGNRNQNGRGHGRAMRY